MIKLKNKPKLKQKIINKSTCKKKKQGEKYSFTLLSD